MPEIHFSLVLAMSRVGFVLVLFLVISLLLYLAIKGIRTGRVGTRRSGYTEQESFVRFWISIVAYFFIAFMLLVGLLSAVFEP